MQSKYWPSILLIALGVTSLASCTPARFESGISGELPMSVKADIVAVHGDFDVSPTPRFLPEIAISYPLALRSAGIPGVVELHVEVSEAGTVDSVQIKNATMPEFIEPVRAGFKRISFIPARRNGTPTAVRLEYKVNFILGDEH